MAYHDMDAFRMYHDADQINSKVDSSEPLKRRICDVKDVGILLLSSTAEILCSAKEVSLMSLTLVW